MRDFWENIKARLIKLSNDDVRLFRWTVKRRVILLAAALIVVGAILIPIVISVSNREVALHFERTDIDPDRPYRYHDGVLFYERPGYYVSIEPSKSTRVEEAEIVVTADGYDMSSTTKIVYLGSAAQILGQDEFVMGGGETILSVRAGRRYAALLYRNQYGDARILVVDALARPKTEVIATIAIAGGEVTAFGFLEADANTELLWVSTLDVNQFSEESLVRIYNCDNGGSLMFYSASLYNQTIEKVFLTERCLYLVGTQDILRYDRTDDGFSSERARVSIYGSRVVDCKQASNGESAYFITMPIVETGEQTHIYRLLTVSQSDDAWATVLQQFLSAPIITVFLQDNSVCVVTAEGYETYNYSGKSTLALPFEDVTPVSAVPCEEGFLLFTTTACYRVTVQ